MVNLSSYLLRLSKTAFLASIKLKLKGGHGGNGLPQYGGVGGQGGAIYLITKENATLRKIIMKHRGGKISAEHGEDSSKLRLLGRKGNDIEVQAPIGITVINAKGQQMKELNVEGDTFLAAYGGSGGCSGNEFIGQNGQDWTLTLDLKLIADVGLVGFPNAGKSTFLKAISKARPKIASYPFTTIKPNVGSIEFSDYRQITVADLPGLIEGAHVNIGMGHKFLKHVERTKLLVFIVDIFGFQLSPVHPKRNCLQNIFSLMKELEMYNESLTKRRAMLLVNKMDLKGSFEIFDKLKEQLSNIEQHLNECPDNIRPKSLIEFDSIIPMAAKERMGIDDVIEDIRKILDLEAERQLLQDLQTQST